METGLTVPTVATLQKMARALEVPLYQLFYEGEVPLKPDSLPKFSDLRPANEDNSGEDGVLSADLQRVLQRLNPEDRRLLLLLTSQMARKKRP